MLSEKVRPKKISEMIGNEQARLSLVKWLEKWKIGSKPVLLSGPPGVGKSTAIHAVAREFGYTVLEYNASDVRTRQHLKTALGPAMVNSSLFRGEEKMLIFLDEVDGLSGRTDYAGTDYILEFIEESRIPVAMAANVEDEPKLKKIQQKSIVLRFRPVDEQIMLVYLRSIAKREHIKAGDEALVEIAKTSRGDVRYALNLLQTFSPRKEGESGASHTDRQFFSDASAIDSLLSSSSLEEATSILRQFDASPYDKIRAVFDTVVSAKNLSVEEKSKALELLSQADILLSRMNRGQKWRLLRYFDRMLALATLGRNLKRQESSIPWNLKLSIWNDGRVIKSLQERFADRYHVGKSDFSSFYLPYFSSYFKKRPDVFESFALKHDLSDSDRRVLLKIAK